MVTGTDPGVMPAFASKASTRLTMLSSKPPKGSNTEPTFDMMMRCVSSQSMDFVKLQHYNIIVGERGDGGDWNLGLSDLPSWGLLLVLENDLLYSFL